MIILEDRMPGRRYFHSVLLTDLAGWLDLGWADTGKRDHRQSVNEPIALIEWQGTEKPPFPTGDR